MERKKQDALFFPRIWLYARTGSGHRAVAEQQLVELREWAICNGYSIVGQSCECAQADSFGGPAYLRCSGPCAEEMLILLQLRDYLVFQEGKENSAKLLQYYNYMM